MTKNFSDFLAEDTKNVRPPRKLSRTVGELKKFLTTIPDDTSIGGRGHYGEMLECYDFSLDELDESYGHGHDSDKKVKCVVFSIEDAGEEPD